ncbi:hypothetical protein BJ508DRAFT_325323 [Ascobolus immersus RN42]|uniref:Uncharacterized protein n=1 Tax=Ascobolus immersus RN42 TaxID=1160509 RepID=A0A3N4IEE6_ASCIM|nr:hypothetical protein BJ508DRAFT_325323 [Ascobolus immersus RN42]
MSDPKDVDQTVGLGPENTDQNSEVHPKVADQTDGAKPKGIDQDDGLNTEKIDQDDGLSSEKLEQKHGLSPEKLDEKDEVEPKNIDRNAEVKPDAAEQNDGLNFPGQIDQMYASEAKPKNINLNYVVRPKDSDPLGGYMFIPTTLEDLDKPYPQQLKDMIAAAPPGPDRERLQATLDSVMECRALSEKKYGPCTDDIVRPRPPMNVNERRIADLAEMLERGPDDEDACNIRAVLAAYKNGDIDLQKRTSSLQVAVFFGGVMKLGWGIEDQSKFDPVQWKKENPAGRLWIENGYINTRMAQFSSFATSGEAIVQAAGTPTGAGAMLQLPGTPTGTEVFRLMPGYERAPHYHFFHIHAFTLHNNWLLMKVLRDTGAGLGLIFRNDLDNLGITNLDLYPFRGPNMILGSTNGEVFRRTVHLTVRLYNYHTGQSVQGHEVMALFAVDETQDSNENPNVGAMRLRLACPTILASVFVAKGPYDPYSIVATTKERLVANMRGYNGEVFNAVDGIV